MRAAVLRAEAVLKRGDVVAERDVG